MMAAISTAAAMSARPSSARSDERGLLAISLSMIEALKPEERLAVFGRLRDSSELAALGLDGLRAITGRAFPRASVDTRCAVREAERALDFCAKRGIGFCCIEDREYPPLLREIAQPPFAIFYRGRLPDPERPCAAIVGTRQPSMEAFLGARRIARELAEKGVPVVSGLALGIDRAAHEGALSAKGATLAVLGTGIDSVYPSSHRELASLILASGGCILSEYPPGFKPLKHRFPERNRIISGLSRSVLVAQAPEKSGALITAEFALDQGRDLFVMAQGIEGERGAGSRKLAEEGACVAHCANDIVAEWGF
jgi:DNA processing protein